MLSEPSPRNATVRPFSSPRCSRIVSRSASNWQVTPVYTRDENHTRAILLLDTTHRKVNVFSTAPESGGTIYRAVFDMDTLSSTSFPESNTVFIKNSPDIRLNNATSTKQTVNSTTGLVVLPAIGTRVSTCTTMTRSWIRHLRGRRRTPQPRHNRLRLCSKNTSSFR